MIRSAMTDRRSFARRSAIDRDSLIAVRMNRHERRSRPKDLLRDRVEPCSSGGYYSELGLGINGVGSNQ
ncbi:hypothetical protein D8S78_22610 [Natrialba swarupiae]|nr:hypothetical protein [Natrialba swarupiae]